MRHQLALPFEPRAAFGRINFVSGPSNETALRLVDSWPDWPTRAAAFHGPVGCGKTHLAEIWGSSASALRLDCADLSIAAVAELPRAANVVVEDVDRAIASRERDEAFMALFERPEGTLLLTGRKHPGAWSTDIPDVRSRFNTLLALDILLPNDVMLSAITRKYFSDRQLTVPEAVVTRMLAVLERSPTAIGAFIAELDERALADRRAVTERLFLELLQERELRGS